jgi:hypothetical protein
VGKIDRDSDSNSDASILCPVTRRFVISSRLLHHPNNSLENNSSFLIASLELISQQNNIGGAFAPSLPPQITPMGLASHVTAS